MRNIVIIEAEIGLLEALLKQEELRQKNATISAEAIHTVIMAHMPLNSSGTFLKAIKSWKEQKEQLDKIILEIELLKNDLELLKNERHNSINKKIASQQF